MLMTLVVGIAKRHMRSRSCGLALLCFLFISIDYASGTPFTVRDSIAMTRVVEFSGYMPNTGQSALFSPDGAYFIIHTQRGDLDRNVNVETLLLYATKDVEHLLKHRRASPPSAHAIAHIDIRHDWAKLGGITWINNSEVAFVTEGDNARPQVFVVNTRSGEMTQVTQNKEGVAAFQIVNDVMVYFAYAPLPVNHALVQSVNDHILAEMLFPTDWSTASLELYKSSRRDRLEQRINIPAMQVSTTAIWISPNGRYAITSSPAVNAPREWIDYIVPRPEIFAWTEDKISADPTSQALLLRSRYQVVDLVTNTAAPIFDAPDGVLAQNGTPPAVFWANDSASVIISNTFLPLQVKDPGEHEKRRRGPAVVEWNLRSQKIDAILWEPIITAAIQSGKDPFEPIIALDWDPRAQRLLVKQDKGKVVSSSFEKHNGKWAQVKALDVSRGLPSVQLQQAQNVRPKVYVSNARCACKRELLDPSPEAEQFTVGYAELITWTDKTGLKWGGGLIYPPHYIAGRRYPFVMQTHGFWRDEFLIDGPGGASTSMAAQALANAGFIVLQVTDNGSSGDESEGITYANGYLAGINLLVDKGLVDPARVGLIAFSRTGLHAIYVLSMYPDLLAAVSISDSTQPGYVASNLIWVNSKFTDVRAQIEKVTGGAPRDVGYSQWFERNPFYRISKAHAAVRIEAIQPESLLGMWETYAVLREANRPVDLTYFPEGSHVLEKPAERLGSQGASVDWFRFWLQDYVDPDPKKVEQYSHWNQLRHRQ